ncbi:MAG: protein rep, partial [Gammaproteobacteria bacterium]|nr:protein rep [Gammaproteobacteria bacterium]
MRKRKEENPDLSTEVLTNNTATDQEHEKRLERYSKAKTHQRAVLEYIKDKAEMVKEYSKMLNCGSLLVFRWWYIENIFRLIGGCSCKQRLLCVLCALRMAARQVMEYTKRIKFVLAGNPYLVPILITRTVKNGSDLDERYNHLVAAHKKMIVHRRRTLSASCRHSTSALRHVHGGAGSYEFKIGRNSGEWHPHIHEIALLDARKYEFVKFRENGKDVYCPVVFQQALAAEWLKATGDSFIVDVRRVGTDENMENGISGMDALVKGVCEAFKYALKFNFLDIPEQVEAYHVLKGRRLVFSYGSLWGVKVPKETVDTIEEELKLKPYVDLVYRYALKKERYELMKSADFGELNEAGKNPGGITRA